MMYHVKVFFVFVLGFAIGVLLAVMLFLSSDVPSRRNNNSLKVITKTSVDFFIDDSSSVSLEENILRLRTVGKKWRESNIDKNKEQNRTELYDESTVVTNTPNLNSINIVCVIFSSDLSRSSAAADTWGRHCNNYHFYGKSNADFYKYLNVTAIKPQHSWHFLCEVIRHVHNLYKDTLNWVIFVPDDIFVIPENLRHYVRYKDHTKAYYLGDISCFWFTYYNTAEAGYVLSSGAIQLLLKIFNSTEACLGGGKHWRNEDYHLGRHMSGLGVRPEDTRDKKGRGRFHTFTPEQLYLPDDVGLLERYFRRRIHPNKQGPGCCDKRTITFRASGQDRIFFYYYMLYKIRTQVTSDFYPNNLSNTHVDTPQVWQKFIMDELGKNTDLSKIDADEYYRVWAAKVTPEELVNQLRVETDVKKSSPNYVNIRRTKFWR
ncbi:C1GALT1-specific chaperone 1-like protein isoform X2 [Nilaparvata lugens]|uniref:C1GALT1-specific chaperone 1-like protein isoform X1 n=1 Tax=Nilaparvata lugens TaxID=108931 RepID=UPI00193DC9AA|nr:C1GALT1-specific chaperone 1-like protein isoform X1 [Nilaparvata lugens]XP_039296777.1 C1GALT1-specific chaperone 1-like protein isoform X2 [Nilaparvata lugens]